MANDGRIVIGFGAVVLGSLWWSARKRAQAEAQQIATLSKRVASARSQAQSESTTIQQLSGRLTSARSQIQQDRSQIAQDKTRIAQLTQQDAQAQAQIAQLQGQLQTATSKIQGLNGQIQSLQAQIQSLQGTLSKTQQQLAQTQQTDQATIQQLQSTIQQLNNTIASLKGQLQHAQQQASNWKQQYQTILALLPPALVVSWKIVGKTTVWDGYYYGYIPAAKVQFTIKVIYKGTSIPFPANEVESITFCSSWAPCNIFKNPGTNQKIVTASYPYGYTYTPQIVVGTSKGQTSDMPKVPIMKS